MFSPGLNVVDRRPQNSNQDMEKRQWIVDRVARDDFHGAGQTVASTNAAIAFKFPANTRL